MLTSARALLILWGFSAILLSCSGSKKSTSQDSGTITINTTQTPASTPPGGYNALQVKYAKYLNTTPDQIQNLKLYGFIDKWLGTTYKWGGVDEKGIDCSAFVQRLLAEVYDIRVPRTSVQQFFTDWIDKFASTAYLSEGDLVFFRTLDNTVISHVGMYLGNNMFISAASRGVSIASLKDPYWLTKFIGAGRVRRSMLKRD
jgi:murein DD-endopeptidase / murein LD-carboxypeptidase